MKLTFLGTCSGTEPWPGRRHCSFILEHRQGVYWFDAGEGCSYTAHLAGVDLLATRAIFISHAHFDHVDGLANLLWNMGKLEGIRGKAHGDVAAGAVRVLIPDLQVWEGVTLMLGGVRAGRVAGIGVRASRYDDGPIYEGEGLKVLARHNRHLGAPSPGLAAAEPGGGWMSFSFRIEADGRKLAYSGDVADVAEVAPLAEGCDLLLMETGHHEVEAVCRHLRDTGLPFGRLGFTHHGRAILADPEGELRKAQHILGDRVFIADDGMEVDL